MIKRLFQLLFLGLPFAVFGQAVPPLWVQDEWRELNYPAGEWCTGFARDRLKAGTAVGDAIKALERDAQNQLAESIILSIEGDARVENSSLSMQAGKNRSEQIVTDYRQAVRTATAATTVKSETKSFHDPKTGEICAFAAARRADLAAFYKKQINLELNKVETTLEVSEQLVAAGKKISAFNRCGEARSSIAGSAYCQNLLAAVSPDIDDEALQIARAADLQRRLEQTLISLEQSTFVYVDCNYEYKNSKDDAFGSDPEIICDIVKQAISENECSVVDDPAEADYELTLTASTSQRSDGKGQYGIISYYANVRGSLYNRMTKKKTADFAIINDADAYAAGRSPEDAATKAFKLPALKNKIMEKILTKIKN